MRNPPLSSPHRDSGPGAPEPPVAVEILEQLKSIDACTVSNAIETLGGRARNEGFTNASIQCRFPQLGSVAGYAVTGRIRSSEAPIAGGWYYDHIDWWRYVLTIPAPRIIVVRDVDERPAGAWFGEIHASICGALECVGCVTNGNVRDLDACSRMSFQLFSGGVVVSHAYAHLIDFGIPVEVGGMRVSPGDLLYGDAQGLVSIPRGLAADVPRAAADIRGREKGFVDFCRSPEFSIETMAAKFEELRMRPAQDGE